MFTLPEPRIRPGSAAAKWLEAQRFYLEQTEGEIAVHANDMQGMLDVCGQLWGYDNVLAAPYEDEEAYRCLMDKVTRAFIYLWREQERTLGKCFMPTHLYAWDSVPPQNGATLSADALVMLSPDFFVTWYQPYLERVSDELGGLTVHSCGNFSQVAAPLCGVRGLRGINASQMDVGQLLAAGADREMVFIFLCPFDQAEALARRARGQSARVAHHYPVLAGRFRHHRALAFKKARGSAEGLVQRLGRMGNRKVARPRARRHINALKIIKGV